MSAPRPALRQGVARTAPLVLRGYYNGLIRLAFLSGAYHISAPLTVLELRTERDVLLAHPALKGTNGCTPTLETLQAHGQQAHGLAHAMARGLGLKAAGHLGLSLLARTPFAAAVPVTQEALKLGLERQITLLFAARTLARGLLPPVRGGFSQPQNKPTKPEV
ncbi:hypothetical protein PUV47_13670 [Pseudovibrio exalbescens]|uniref:hypothetical protein n=1 Tax=Pseudovibrio exalbescens TaxID=197461 RepID=UPI002366EFB3|nr:hypothetical protein [Pseudovibrio exalbescens]MDD7910972.1 hypothetical protein [Pseudovibrio exalbescens]